MEKTVHLFNTDETFKSTYYSEDYSEPWVSTSISTGLVKYNKTIADLEYEEVYGKPLTFEILSNGYVQFNKDGEYKLNNGNWTNFSESQQITVSTNDVLSFRANVYTSEPYFSTSCNYNLSGNIHSILSKDFLSENYDAVPTVTYTSLFAYSSGLIDASNLLLPWKNLNKPSWASIWGIYEGLFEGCSNLTNGPSLIATVLGPCCYKQMFKGCTSLTTAPDLLVTTPAIKCYDKMFYGCSSLNYIKCLLNDTNVDYTYDWLNGVASSGTFIYSPFAKWQKLNPVYDGNNHSFPLLYCGIPDNWTSYDINNENTKRDADPYLKIIDPYQGDHVDWGYSDAMHYGFYRDSSEDYYEWQCVIYDNTNPSYHIISYRDEDYTYELLDAPEWLTANITFKDDWNVPILTIQFSTDGEEYEEFDEDLRIRITSTQSQNGPQWILKIRYIYSE